ncbi:MAG: hypothetical protein M3P18_26510 [Actinomycetota bacterium]|nr:hypothetical protein [Actinomycetota bacterium]
MTDGKKLAIAGGVIGLILVLFWSVGSSLSHPKQAARSWSSPVEDPSGSPWPSPTSVEVTAGASPGPGELGVARRRSYAIALSRLAGLPPDATSGTRLQLWVAWEPPITHKPRIQRLVTGVELDHIVPPVTPDGSAVALLEVPADQVPSLLYGDRYGSLSAVVTP